MTSTHSSARASSPPYALAFMRTAPPTVPGMLTPNSIPLSPARAACADTAGRRAPPPQSMRVPVHGDLGELLVKFQDKSADAGVRYQEVRPRAHDPYLHALRRRPRQDAPRAPATVPGRANSSAGPPVRIVVSRDSG